MNEGLTLTCQIISALSIITNLYLVYVYYTCSIKVISSYKHFFLLTAVQDILYSICLIVLTPLVITSDYAFVFFATGLLHKHAVGHGLMKAFSSIFLFSIALITYSFVYRYVQVCRPHLLDLDRCGYGMISVFIINITIIISWIGGAHIIYSPDALLIEQLSESVRNHTGIELSESSSAGLSKKRLLDSFDTTLLFCGNITVLCLASFIMTYLAVRIISTLKKSTFSIYLRSMHRRLFVLLLLQTACPFIFLHAPIFIIFIYTFVGLEMPLSGMYLISIFQSLFPLINPFVIIGFLDDYRNHTLIKLRLRSKH